MFIFTRRDLIVLAVLLVSAIGLAACGSSDSTKKDLGKQYRRTLDAATVACKDTRITPAHRGQLIIERRQYFGDVNRALTMIGDGINPANAVSGKALDADLKATCPQVAAVVTQLEAKS
jgi:hypothetical protein